MASKYTDKLKENLYGSGLKIAAHVAEERKYAVYIWIDETDELYYTPETAAKARTKGRNVRALYTLVNEDTK